MFRRALITDEVSQDPTDAVRLARRFGLDGIELRSAWDRQPHQLARDQVRALRRMAGDARLAVCAVATPVFKCALDDRDAVREHVEILKRSLDVCGELDAPYARVFTFWKPGAPGAPADAGPQRRWEDVRSAIADRLADAAEVATDFGRSLVVEHEPSVHGSSAARVAELLERIGHPALGAVWDPGNTAYDPEGEPAYPESYEILKAHLRHMHLKDARRDPTTGIVEAVALGDGQIPYRDIFRRLLDDGYAGFASLETHHRAGAVVGEEMARLPGGTAFSAGGVAASLLCLRRWAQMLAALGIEVPEGNA
jgi:sugar phosphate isomerase/epimerase